MNEDTDKSEYYLGDYITDKDEYFFCYFIAEIDYAIAFCPFPQKRILIWAKAKTMQEARKNIAKKLGSGHFK